jgi:hypothetical protein
MNAIDAIFLALLAFIDLAFLVYWRGLRARRIQGEKMSLILRFALQRQNE